MADPKFNIPKPTLRSFSLLFREAAQGGGVPAKVVENVYRGAERPSIQFRVRGNILTPRQKRDAFITHELVERLVLQKLGGSRTAPLGVTKAQSRAAHEFARKGEQVTRRFNMKMNITKRRHLRAQGRGLK